MDQHEDTLIWGVNPFCEILSAPLRVSSIHNNLGTGKKRMGCMKLTVHSEPSRCINDTSDVLAAGRFTGSGHPSWTGQRAFFRPLLSTLTTPLQQLCLGQSLWSEAFRVYKTASVITDTLDARYHQETRPGTKAWWAR